MSHVQAIDKQMSSTRIFSPAKTVCHEIVNKIHDNHILQFGRSGMRTHCARWSVSVDWYVEVLKAHSHGRLNRCDSVAEGTTSNTVALLNAQLLVAATELRSSSNQWFTLNMFNIWQPAANRCDWIARLNKYMLELDKISLFCHLSRRDGHTIF